MARRRFILESRQSLPSMQTEGEHVPPDGKSSWGARSPERLENVPSVFHSLPLTRIQVHAHVAIGKMHAGAFLLAVRSPAEARELICILCWYLHEDAAVVNGRADAVARVCWMGTSQTCDDSILLCRRRLVVTQQWRIVAWRAELH